MTNQKWTGNKQTKNPNKIDYKYFVRFTLATGREPSLGQE